MRAIGDRTALAIERARMTDALREREQRIAELSGHLLRVQEEERKRISRELHDETGQALMVIRLYLGMMETGLYGERQRGKIRETVDVVDRTIEGIRRIIGTPLSAGATGTRLDGRGEQRSQGFCEERRRESRVHDCRRRRQTCSGNGKSGVSRCAGSTAQRGETRPCDGTSQSSWSAKTNW